MREHKYRAWDTTRKKMYSANELGADQETLSVDGRGFVNVSGTSTRLSQFHAHLLPLEYTGLKDKNGIEIYEGDIILIHHTHPKWKGKESKWKVTTEETSWGYAFDWEHISGYECSTHVMRDNPCNYEVIGNIYENKDLMKEEKQL